MRAKRDYDLREIFRYINPIMLYGKHLGLRGNLEQHLKDKNPKAVELHKRVQALQDEILTKGLIKPKAVFKFFAVEATGNRMNLFESPSAAAPLAGFEFPRQPAGERLCLADFVRPAGTGRDYAAMFVVTCGAAL